METGVFADFDDESVWKASLKRALDDSTRNFIVEFGKDEAQIAFDLEVQDVEQLLTETSRPTERPVRWINLWAPNMQQDIVNLFGRHYKFSPRLLAIIRTAPRESKPRQSSKHVNRLRVPRPFHNKDDIETATKAIGAFPQSNGTPNPPPPKSQHLPREHSHASHYSIAAQMINYQSIDVGAHFLCIGANWMHQIAPDENTEADKLLEELKERRVWSWIVLCDDNTVISLHEDTRPVNNVEDLKSIRGNTLSVLTQMSIHGHQSASPISMQTVRQVLELGAAQANPGIEGASNLFYYLFDDWRAVFLTVAKFSAALAHLRQVILEDMTRKASTTPDIRIIKRLHLLGREIRQMQHLYAGYKNLIQRILEPKATVIHGSNSNSSVALADISSRAVVLARSASQRFERLGDRIQLLILSETQEFLAEKDALTSTYFNINAQKDSEATARLTRSATLLAKLSVLFLPVSLMTSYFSVQIPDLASAYTSKDYWYAFAGIMSISFLSLFFFSKMLIVLTEHLDLLFKNIGKTWKKWFASKFLKRTEEATVEDEAKKP